MKRIIVLIFIATLLAGCYPGDPMEVYGRLMKPHPCHTDGVPATCPGGHDQG